MEESSSSSVVLPESGSGDSDKVVAVNQGQAKKKVAFAPEAQRKKAEATNEKDKMNKTLPMEFEHVEASYEDTDDEPEQLGNEKPAAKQQEPAPQPKKKSSCCILI